MGLFGLIFCLFGVFLSYREGGFFVCLFLQKCWILSAVAKACDCGSLWGCKALQNAECSEKNCTRYTWSLVLQIKWRLFGLSVSLLTCIVEDIYPSLIKRVMLKINNLFSEVSECLMLNATGNLPAKLRISVLWGGTSEYSVNNAYGCVLTGEGKTKLLCLGWACQKERWMKCWQQEQFSN